MLIQILVTDRLVLEWLGEACGSARRRLGLRLGDAMLVPVVAFATLSYAYDMHDPTALASYGLLVLVAAAYAIAVGVSERSGATWQRAVAARAAHRMLFMRLAGLVLSGAALANADYLDAARAALLAFYCYLIPVPAPLPLVASVT